jgi:hypothetical protein
LLAFKGNQGSLCEQVEEAFIDANARDYEGVRSDSFQTAERVATGATRRAGA